MTDLSKEVCWTCPAVVLWAFGHTHFNCDFIDAATGKRAMANQKGYSRLEADGFDAGKVVTLPMDRSHRHAIETNTLQDTKAAGMSKGNWKAARQLMKSLRPKN